MGRRLTDEERVLRDIPESSWQVTVMEILAENGYLVYHDNTQWRNKFGQLARANTPGMPDIVAVRMDPPDFFFAELKKELGKLSEDQIRWIEAIRATGIPCYVWRPSDAPEVRRRATPELQPQDRYAS